MSASHFAPAACSRLIVKIGSALLVDPYGKVRREWLEGVVADLAARHRAGQQIAVVSSGAIALGARRLGRARRLEHAIEPHDPPGQSPVVAAKRRSESFVDIVVTIHTPIVNVHP